MTNDVRHEYRTLSDEEKALVKDVKDKGLDFLKLCDAVGTSREVSIAKTNIEQAVMWLTKHITR